MSQLSSASITSPLVSSLSWWQKWIRAITRPSIATFESFANDPKATIGRAYIWVFSSTLVAYGISFLFASLDIGGVGLGGGAPLFYIPVLSIISAVAVLIFFTISTAITHWIASIVGGAGTYKKFAYTTAAHAAPALFIFLLIGLFVLDSSLNSILYWVFGLYIIVLGVITIKAVYRFGWTKAIVTYVVMISALSLPVLVLYLLFLSV